MKKFKTLSIILVFAFVLVALTSCFTTNTVLDSRKVDSPIPIAEPNNFKVAGSLEKTFDIRYRAFTNTQKPSDAELLEKIVKQTQKKFGQAAIPGDIIFTRILRDRTDMFALIPGSGVNFSDMSYKIKATWNVYVPI
jgi:hypothetical protein